jgi:hypothetical protein
MADTIRCPQCGCAVSVEAAFAAKARDEIRRELVESMREAQDSIAKREAEAARREADVERRVDVQVKAAAAKAALKAKTEAEAAVAFELEAAKSDLSNARSELGKAKKEELSLRRERQQLEQEKADLALTVQRQLDEERRQIHEKASADVADRHALLMKEKEALIEGMRKTIDELKQKSEQGSQQLQGEVLETSLEDALRREFPADVIEPVAKGVRGADVIQRVRLSTGVECGVILWESKRTRSWVDGWLPKLRDDQREMRAEIAALVTQMLPKGASPVSSIDGVWVSTFPCYVGLAHLLRKCLIDVATAHRAQDGRNEKMAILYEYLTGAGFRSRVEGLLEPFRQMMTDLEDEKRAVQRIWSKREKQLDRALRSTTGLYGDLEGIVGATLPGIASLALPSADAAGGAASADAPEATSRS